MWNTSDLKHRKLKNAPLKEAIFEVRWAPVLDTNGVPEDMGYQLAQGLFAKGIRGKFPVHKNINTVPEILRVFPVIQHQFWSDELTWPVVQLGPGILSVNNTEANYIWSETFRPHILLALDLLEESYEKEFIFKSIALRYIDAIDLNIPLDGLSDFVGKNLHTQMQNNYKVPGKPQGLSIVQSYGLEDGSVLNIQIHNGVNQSNRKNSLIWSTEVQKSGNLSKEDVIQWLDMAHDVTSDTFVNMLNPDFYDSFNR